MRKDYTIKELKNVCVLKFNVPNKNGRIYTPESINLEDPVIKEKLCCHAFFGTIDISEEDIRNDDMSKISHIITALHKHEDGLYADIDIIDTPYGNILKDVLENTSIGAFRTVGEGNVEAAAETNASNVLDYKLITICFFTAPA